MSLILEGINMPKEKDEALLLLILGDGTVAEKIDSDRYEEMTDTKAIQIPKGHGRLIDGDELKSIKSIQSADFNSIETIQKWMDNAPTILEAEE